MDPLIRLQQVGVSRLTIDSRRVAADTAFVALPPATQGSRDGRDFALNAIAAGSPLVLGEGAAPAGVQIHQWLNWRQRDRTTLRWRLGLPARLGKLRVIGVTGTDGKTSVAWLASEPAQCSGA